MQFFILILILCLVVFLFSLYSIAHDDFILLRRNVSTEDVFNHAIVASLIVLLFSRILYVLLHPKPVFLSPLGFLIFPYFPGLSVVGGVFGGLLFLLFLARRRAYPVGRIFDFFALSFLCAMPFGFIGYILLSGNRSALVVSEFFFFLLLLIVSLLILMPRFIKSGKEDGIIGFIFLTSFSAVFLVHNFVTKAIFNIRNFDNIILIAMLALSLGMLLSQLLRGRFSFRK